MESLQLADIWILQVLISICQNSTEKIMKSVNKFLMFCIK